jgi:hypothetical protein
MKTLLATAALALALAAPPPATAAEKYLPMTIDFVGDWCFDNRDGNTINYQLPSWHLDGTATCKDILSVHKWSFNAPGRDDLGCYPIAMKTGEDRAPSGTAYQATITARCYANGPMTNANSQVMTFFFSRYKGNLYVTRR